MYAIQCCQAEVDYFHGVVNGLLDTLLPYIRVTKYTADKPWVTEQFRNLIRKRQRSLLSGNRREYCKLQNRVQRLSISLRKRYYDTKIRALHEADSHSWWKCTKQFLSAEKKLTYSLTSRYPPDKKLVRHHKPLLSRFHKISHQLTLSFLIYLRTSLLIQSMLLNIIKLKSVLQN